MAKSSAWISRRLRMTAPANSRAACRWAALAGLLVAGLACGPALTGPDTVATVNAVSMRVQATLGAATPGLALTPAASTLAAPATALIQPVTLTPPPLTTLAGPLTPAPSPTFSAPAASATPPRRSNGALLAAHFWPTPPTVDGDLSEWPDLPNLADQIVYRPENWTGPADLSGRFAVAWDAQALYLAVLATDETRVQTQQGELIFRGDSVEVLLDADLAGDFSRAQLDADDYQLGLSPGPLTGGGEAPDAYRWFPRGQAGRPGGLALGARPTEAGYTLEAALPWALFSLTPAPGARFGFTLALSDNDTPDTADQQSLVASVPGRRLTDPTTWGTLELTGAP